MFWRAIPECWLQVFINNLCNDLLSRPDISRRPHLKALSSREARQQLRVRAYTFLDTTTPYPICQHSSNILQPDREFGLKTLSGALRRVPLHASRIYISELTPWPYTDDRSLRRTHL